MRKQHVVKWISFVVIATCATWSAFATCCWKVVQDSGTVCWQAGQCVKSYSGQCGAQTFQSLKFNTGSNIIGRTVRITTGIESGKRNYGRDTSANPAVCWDLSKTYLAWPNDTTCTGNNFNCSGSDHGGVPALTTYGDVCTEDDPSCKNPIAPNPPS